jgi:formyl-CoA transferase
MNRFGPDVDVSGAPLRGMRVVELTMGVAGALTGELLALLGADVVRVEGLGGDPARLAADGRSSAGFVLANLSKRSVVADPDTATGTALVMALATGADVLIENVGPAELARFGLTTGALRKVAQLVQLSIVGCDPDWEFSDLTLTEAVLQCLSGIARITGEPDEPPLRVGPDAAAAAGAIYGAIGVLAALIQRARTGRGQRVEVSTLDAAMNLCRTHFSRSSESGEFHPRPGNRQPAAQAEPTGVFPAAGGGPQDHVFAHASPEHLWRRLLSVIGREDLVDDPRFVDGPTRLVHREDVHAVVDQWTRRHSARHILRVWGAAGIPVGATLTTRDLSSDATLRLEGQFAEVDQSEWGRIPVPVLPFTFNGARPATPTEAPQLGEHTADLERAVDTDWSCENGTVDGPTPGEPALAGVRVLDFTQALSGPIATQVLAFLGADVVRIQRPAAPSLGIERPWLKLDQLSMNKRSVVLDVKSDAGRATVRRLVPRFDVVMENFAPGTIERLGFGWDELRALNPSIVFGRVKGFGPTSPYRDYLAFDNVAEAMGGACDLTGHPDQEPMLPGPHLADIGTGLVSALGVLSMLYARLNSGRGGEVVCSMQGTVATVFSRLAFAAQLASGDTPLRNGFGDLGAQQAPAGAYRCAGGDMNDYCYIAVKDEPRWHALTEVMGRSDLTRDRRFATVSDRWTNRAALDAEIQRWTEQRPKRAVAHLLADAGVEAAPILDTAELINDPVLQRRGVFTAVPHPVHGEVFHIHWPIRMDHSFVAMEPAPRLGEHNAELLTDAFR